MILKDLETYWAQYLSHIVPVERVYVSDNMQDIDGYYANLIPLGAGVENWPSGGPRVETFSFQIDIYGPDSAVINMGDELMDILNWAKPASTVGTSLGLIMQNYQWEREDSETWHWWAEYDWQIQKS